MYKILLIGAGGTIFSIVEKNIVRVAQNVEELVAMVPRIREVSDLELEIVVQLDSTNVAITEWQSIFKAIVARYNDFDAFVIAHGTNTMAYTATALAFALGSTLTKPVILTGSQLPLTAYGDDAHFNLEHSVQVAVEAIDKRIAEVMICFHDVVLRGCRAVKVTETGFRAFGTPAIDPIGAINANGAFFAPHARAVPNDRFRPNPKVNFSSNVVCIDLSPGTSPAILERLARDPDLQGIVLKSHGAGSVPDFGSVSLIPLIEEATARGLPVVVATRYLGGNSFKLTNDEPAVNALNAGAIASRDMTEVAAYLKLIYLLGLGYDYFTIVDMFSKSFVGEVS